MLTRESFRGCLIGQCVGDALGMPVERHSLEECQRYMENMKAGRVEQNRHPSFPFGQYTDDSQLARELVISFIACEGFDPEDYARRIARIHNSHKIVGSSSASKKVALRLSQGMPWQEAGTPAPYARNGSAMRAAPIGLFFCHNPDQLIKAAVEQSLITHQDPRSAAGAVAIAGAVALAVEKKPTDPKVFLTQLSTWMRPVESSVAAAVDELVDWVELPVSEASERIAPMGNPPDSLKEWEGISPWVVPSILWSLYAFLHSPDDYQRTLRTAISGGGDTDTTAAMAGAISGAYLGLEIIPPAIAQRLTDQGRWGYEPLLSLADLGFHLARVRQLEDEESISHRWASEVSG